MGSVYYMDKETFVLKSKQQILVYNYMIEDLKNILPIVQKFDQKFLTKRLTTAMEKVLKHCIVSLHTDKIKISIQGELRYVKGGGYIEWDSYDIDLDVNRLGWLLNSEKSIENIQSTINYFEKQINEYQLCITNYDEFVNKRLEIEKQIEEYQKLVPYCMRTYYDVYGTKYYIDKMK